MSNATRRIGTLTRRSRSTKINTGFDNFADRNQLVERARLGARTMQNWLNTAQAAEHLGYSVKTISRFCRENKLKHTRVGKRGDYRFKVEWLDSFMENQSAGPTRASYVPPKVQVGKQSRTLARLRERRQKTAS